MALRVGDWSDGPVHLMMGDVRERLADLESQSVQCVVTSPPYWGLRDYGADGQIGLEETPEAFVTVMVDVFRAVRRALKLDGTLWLNLGDSYAGGGNGARDPDIWPKQSRNANGFRSVHVKAGSGLKVKDLAGIPWRVALALQADGWYLRSDIIWAKTNPMPESVTDRPSKAHEYLFLLTRAPRYFYDADAIREPHSETSLRRVGGDIEGSRPDAERREGVTTPGTAKRWHVDQITLARGGRNRQSVWSIATEAFPEAHFATFPEALVEPCIKAGSREGDVVLDPFAGSGTTLAVARRLGRRAIGIELQPNYLPLIQRRVMEAAMPLTEAIVMQGEEVSA